MAITGLTREGAARLLFDSSGRFVPLISGSGVIFFGLLMSLFGKGSVRLVFGVRVTTGGRSACAVVLTVKRSIAHKSQKTHRNQTHFLWHSSE